MGLSFPETSWQWESPGNVWQEQPTLHPFSWAWAPICFLVSISAPVTELLCVLGQEVMLLWASVSLPRK